MNNKLNIQCWKFDVGRSTYDGVGDQKRSEGEPMGTFIKKGLALGLLGVALWSLTALGPSPESGPGRGERPEGVAFAVMMTVFEVSSVWGQGVSGPSPVSRGRLVIHYPLLYSILLILLLVAILGLALILNRLFTTKLKTFENRIAYLEYSVKDLYSRQKEDMDGLLRQIHNLPGKAKTNESKKAPEKDTTVGKSPIPSGPNPSTDQ
jgi:hypothetical protein